MTGRFQHILSQLYLPIGSGVNSQSIQTRGPVLAGSQESWWFQSQGTFLSDWGIKSLEKGGAQYASFVVQVSTSHRYLLNTSMNKCFGTPSSSACTCFLGQCRFFLWQMTKMLYLTST
jgi:hypothetical protein